MTEKSEQCRDGHDADISTYSISGWGGGGGVTSVLLVENCFAHPCYDIFSNLVSHFVVDDK